MAGDNTPNAQNMVLDELGKRTNTVIEMTYVASADLDTKISTMAASDTLPDLFFVSGSTAQDFIDAGLLYDLTGLEDKAPNWFGNASDLIPQMTLNQEGIYVIPTGEVNWANNLNIRTDWLENLGMEMPANLDMNCMTCMRRSRTAIRTVMARMTPLPCVPIRIPGRLNPSLELMGFLLILPSCWRMEQFPAG